LEKRTLGSERIPDKADPDIKHPQQTLTLHGGKSVSASRAGTKNQEGFRMALLRSVRWLLLALVVTLIPVSSQAGVFISVGVAPPMLPVYEQPPCPEPGLMWTPGYWAYGQDGYYWVPGTWVPAPYEGALWTPGYWGWSNGMYVFHDGYWGRHIGYYGGVNYGFGYFGIGFAGGEWRGHDFHYNTAVMHVDRRFVRNTFEDRGRMDRGFVDRNSHVAFSGGPGGIRHDPRPDERFAEHEQHMDRSPFQQQHESMARTDRNSYVKNNGGRPQNLAVDRPLGGERVQPGNNFVRGGAQNHANPQPNIQRNAPPQQFPQPQQRNAQPQQQQPQQRNASPQQFQQPQQRNAPPQQSQQPQQRPAAPPQAHQPAASHTAPKPQAAPKDEHKR
jgi:hypothetical protein